MTTMATSVPSKMRALYHCPASTAITNLSTTDLPRTDSGIIFDTDFPTPRQAANQYLIKVQAASFSHDGLRLASALNPSKSIPQIPIHNFSGTITSTPPSSSTPKFHPNDPVFGLISHTRDGAAADFVVATEDELALKPKSITPSEAAAIPLPALTAWQSLFTYSGLDPSNAANDSSPRVALRVLITNARSSEVATQALQLLRAPSLFPHYTPWICATCSSPEEEAFLREEAKVNAIITAPLPLPDTFDLASTFRTCNWDPVDIVLDCAGDQMFTQAHSPAVVKDHGAVLTAVDSLAPERGDVEAESRKRRLLSRFVAVRPDGEALRRIAGLVEEGALRGRVVSIADLVHGVDVLAKGAAGVGGGRRGGMMVFRVDV